MSQVTYDLPDELSPQAASRRGTKLIDQHFAIREGSPITVLVRRAEPFHDEKELSEASKQLTERLYCDGVDSVRSLTDPLGEYPPGKAMGIYDQGLRTVLRQFRVTRERYLSTVESLGMRVARFDVLLSDNPFSREADQTLARIKTAMEEEIQESSSVWKDANAAFTGTTVGISDLRQVTQSDQRRIQILVTLGVWLVLVLVLRRGVLSTYLICTVLLSYFATLGITYFTFSLIYEDYTGLDWKVPVFLFVILVAVGQDYNVYLVTRVFEELEKYEVGQAVQRALTATGGIITSCGLVMAGTFVAMTSPAVWNWLGGHFPTWISTDAPVLRGITELGFALSFGVLLDTLVVRSLLVPAFIMIYPQSAVRKSATN